MKLLANFIIVFWAIGFNTSITIAQTPVELFAGVQKTSIDVMFFKFFTTKTGQRSNWLFFNRNRASWDYQMTTTSNLPQFGCTEAWSFNLPKWKGFAPVVVVSLLNRGIFPKAGLQFAKQQKTYTFFSWAVVDLLKNPNIDVFFLGRYTPKLTDKLNLFAQIETIHSLPTSNSHLYTFTQRLRIGLKQSLLQWGLGADFTQQGRTDFVQTNNCGVFMRYEF